MGNHTLYIYMKHGSNEMKLACYIYYSPGIKFYRQFQKVGARKFRCHNLFVQNHSLSSMQILSLMMPALKSWYCCSITGYINTCQKGKLLCLLWSFLLYWTFCLLWSFSCWTTGCLPTACKQRMILDICYGLWLIMIDTKIFWFQMISTIFMAY